MLLELMLDNPDLKFEFYHVDGRFLHIKISKSATNGLIESSTKVFEINHFYNPPSLGFVLGQMIIMIKRFRN